MQIFSRWGETVLVGYDLIPNEPSKGWDGTFRGKELDPAVFVYHATIEDKNGNQRGYKGAVTLLR